MEEGSKGFLLQDEHGTDLFCFCLCGDGVKLTMNDSAGNPRIEVSAPGKGSPSITLRGEGKVNVLKP